MIKKKRQSKANKKSNKSFVNALLIIGFTGLMFYVFKSNRVFSAKPNKMTEVASIPEISLIQEPKLESVISPEKLQEDLNRRRLAGIAKDRFGLQTLQSDQATQLEVLLRFSSQKLWCMAGDLDTMRQASSDLQAKNFLLSIENFKRGDRNILAKFVSWEDLVQGLQIKINFALSERTENFAFNICSDRNHRGSCQEKEIKPHGELVSNLEQKNNAALPGDYLFYFQHLILEQGGLHVYHVENFGLNERAELSSFLMSSYAVSLKDFDFAWKRLSALRSTHLMLGKNAIEVMIPMNDPRCLEESLGQNRD